MCNLEGKKFPLAARAVLHNTYVDDILAGGDTVEEVIQLRDELIQLLSNGSFELHKWCSNNPSILNGIPIELQHFDEREMNHDLIVKTLGLSFDVKLDMFKISSPKESITKANTKRKILSFLCKFYDPLGLVGPLFVSAKIIMQRLWLKKIDWDDILSDELLETWEEFVENLRKMEPINIPRYLQLNSHATSELVGFCDASMFAYGAVVYIRTVNETVTSTLLCSKSRIAPLNKKLTIPRLELNSALLLANVIHKVYSVLKKRINKVYLYSDSNIVLAWIKTNSVKLNPYVANRIIKIQGLTKGMQWSYINTKDNPADCLSRGINPNEISKNKIWWYGPSYFLNVNYKHPLSEVKLAEPLPEQKIACTQIILESSTLFAKYSSISKLERIIAWILRFKHNASRPKYKLVGNLKPFEVYNALEKILIVEQQFHFHEEFKLIQNGQQVKTQLASLHPFIDRRGILRVGGRLQNAQIEYDQKHPIILPKKSIITDLIIIREHKKLLHAGQKQILSSLNLKYWLINGNREIKKIIHKCVICFRLKAQCAQQLMGSLPEPRVTYNRPFHNVGVDFCGPFQLKQSTIRRSVITKSYIALFVCFSIKAIHMELLSDLTADNFLSVLKRFISRRGKPAKIYCDNGGTFKGANRKLSELRNMCKKESANK
ncbi:hypothetical protein PPYR_05049, partial [Photinus pyralis]